MVNHLSPSIVTPYKSVAVALIFAVLLGPVGLLYSTFWGGLFMILIGIVVCNSKLLVPILLFWILCCIWAVGAAELRNKKIYQKALQGKPL